MKPRKQVREVYKKYQERDEEYINDIEFLSEKLSTDFRADCSPTFFAGKPESPIALVGLNPKLGSNHDTEEELKQDFDDYWSFQKNFFQVFPEEIGSAKYYATIENLIRGLQGKDFKEHCSSKKAMKDFHGTLINADILPFHSKNTESHMDEEIRERMSKYADVTESVLKSREREVLIIKGKKPFLYYKPEIGDHSWNKREISGGNTVEWKTTELLGMKTLVLKQDINEYQGVSHRDRYEIGKKAKQELDI